MKVETFLRLNGRFIPLLECFQVVCDENYIEGAIEITIQNKKILTCEYWDYVDQLWSYFLKGIDAISRKQSFSTYLPDQPVEVIFKLLNSEKVLVEIKTNNTSIGQAIEREIFLREMLGSCRIFFQKLPIIAPSTESLSKHSLARIEEIYKHIKKIKKDQ